MVVKGTRGERNLWQFGMIPVGLRGGQRKEPSLSRREGGRESKPQEGRDIEKMTIVNYHDHHHHEERRDHDFMIMRYFCIRL